MPEKFISEEFYFSYFGITIPDIIYITYILYFSPGGYLFGFDFAVIAGLCPFLRNSLHLIRCGRVFLQVLWQ